MRQTSSNIDVGDLAKRLSAALADAASRAETETADGALARGIIYSFGAFHDLAEQQLRQALAIDPSQFDAAARLVLVQLRAGETAAALETAVGLASKAPDYAMEEITTGGRIGAYSLLGLALIASKRDAEAIRAFDTAVEASGEDSIAWAYLAQLQPGSADKRSGNGVAGRSPRFAALGSLLDAAAIKPGIFSPAAVAAVSRFDQVAVHGRPLMVAGAAEVATLVDGDGWSAVAAIT